jgi:colanic acid biosynthesis glycosyl transferase WcaI
MRRGHEVSVVAPFPNRPAGRVFAGFRRHWSERRTEDGGIDVVRCFSFLSRRPSLGSRLLESASFSLTAGWQALLAKRPAVIYSNAWPILGASVLLAVARLRGARLVVNVQDLYPESLESQLRIAAEGPAARWLRALDGFVARRCDAVLLVSDGFLEAYRLARRVRAERLEVMPNWSGDSGELPADPDVARFRAENGIPSGAFVVGYGGNIGTAAGVEGLIEAFAAQSSPDIHLLVAGEGSNLAACRELALKTAPGRVHFRTPWPADETSLALRSADLLAIPTLSAQSDVSAPSKVMSCLLSGRPVVAVASSGSALAKAVERSGAGWVVGPGDTEALTAKIEEIAALDGNERRRRGEAGRDFALREYAPGAGASRIVSVLERVASRSGDHP